MSTDSLLVWTLLYVVVPTWLAFGLADWQCHRRARLRIREPLLHLARLTTSGLALLAALFLQVNAAIMLLMLGTLVAHQAIAIADVRHAYPTRSVSPAEQHVHGALEALPIAATFLIIVLHWPQLRALWSGGASFALTLKEPGLPGWYRVAVLVAFVLFGVLPYAEELARALRFRRGTAA